MTSEHKQVFVKHDPDEVYEDGTTEPSDNGTEIDHIVEDGKVVGVIIGQGDLTSPWSENHALVVILQDDEDVAQAIVLALRQAFPNLK